MLRNQDVGRHMTEMPVCVLAIVFTGGRASVLAGVVAGVLALTMMAWPAAGLARDHFVDPAAPAFMSDGTQARPWSSLSAALQSGALAGGDRVVLADGHYGRPWISGLSYDPPLEIVAETPRKAHFQGIRVGSADGLVFRDLAIWPLEPPERPRPLVSTSESARDIQFIGLDIRGRSDAPDSYLDWTLQDWTGTWRSNGADLRGPRNLIAHSRITGVAFGITLGGPASQAVGNRISGFSGDGIRILGDGNAAVRNRIENCFDVDRNHDDGIQAWAPTDRPIETRALSDVLLDGNTIVEWTAAAPHPLRCRLQGIGFFDGMFDRAVIRNNLVVVDQHHGISLYGARDSRVVNNTVVHIDATGVPSPAIRLYDHKRGYPSSGNRILNNIAMGYHNKSADPPALAESDNAIVRYPQRTFRDPARGDYRLRSDSPLVDAARPGNAPGHDISLTPRPQGAAPDFGAHEQ